MKYKKKLKETCKYIRKHMKKPRGWKPEIALVLGSGLGDLVSLIDDAVEIPYSKIPHFKKSGAALHKSVLVLGTLQGVRVVCMQGRVHQYEGCTSAQIVYPILTAQALGAKRLLMTNVTGSIRRDLTPGSVVAITDHINFTGKTAFTLRKEAEVSGGIVFTDMTEAYTPALIERAHRAAEVSGVELAEGVYVGTHGPQFETPAEIRAFKAWGADVVGMSTVVETIAARTANMEILCLSGVINAAAGLSEEELTIEHMQAAMVSAAMKMSSIICEFMKQEHAEDDVDETDENEVGVSAN